MRRGTVVRVRAGLLVAAVAVVLPLAGCGADENEQRGEPSGADPQTPTDESAAPDAETLPESGASETDEHRTDEPATDQPNTDQPNTGDSTTAPPTDGEQGTADVPQLLEFSATTLDGGTFEGADLANRPAVLWFWAPWCTKCMAAAPDVVDLAETYAGEIAVVGVASLGTEPEMRDFVDRTDTEVLTQLIDEEGAVWQRFEIAQQSTYAVRDADGEVTRRGAMSVTELGEAVADLVG